MSVEKLKSLCVWQLSAVQLKLPLSVRYNFVAALGNNTVISMA